LIGSLERSAAFIKQIPAETVRYENGVLTNVNNEYVIYNHAELDRLGNLYEFLSSERYDDVQLYIFLDCSPEDKMRFEKSKNEEVRVLDFYKTKSKTKTKMSVNECVNNLEKYVSKTVFVMVYGGDWNLPEFEEDCQKNKCYPLGYRRYKTDGKDEYIFQLAKDFYEDTYYQNKTKINIYLNDFHPKRKLICEEKRNKNKTLAINFDRTKMRIDDLKGFLKHHQEVLAIPSKKMALVACRDEKSVFTSLPPEIVSSHILCSFFSVMRDSAKTIYTEVPRENKPGNC